jgi:RNAse (barnase) inhibitor barstar
MKIATIDLSSVTSWESFHELFARSFDFPSYYGRNMDAWIDCMEDFAIAGEDCLRLDLKGMIPLKDRSPEIYEAINECAAFINYRSAEAGGESVIALCYGND